MMFMFAVSATAQVARPATAPNQPHAAAQGNPACQRILAECKRQGFIVGQWKKDNGVWKDCFDPVIRGGTPTQDGKPVNLAVSPQDVQSCRASVHHR